MSDEPAEQEQTDEPADAAPEFTEPVAVAPQASNLTFEEQRAQKRRDLADKIEETEREIANHAVRIAELKEMTKTQQGALESDVDLLRELRTKLAFHDTGADEETPGPLFDQPDTDGEQQAAAEQQDGEANGEAPSDPVRWEDKTLADLGITGKLAENLHAANLGTLGKLIDYQRTEAHFDAIHGVGKAASEKIEQKILDYFKANPREPAEQLEEATA